MLLITLVFNLFVLSTSVRVSAQTTNTICASNSSTSFLFNKAGESPCLVWAKLQSLCIPDTAFVNVPPLVDHTYGYNSPGDGGSACQCNIAAYNLMAACSWCQVGGDSTWATQWSYSTGCTTFQENGLGFNQDVIDLPPFVWRTWGTSRFDPALAAAAAPSFATTSLPSASATLGRSFPPAQTSTSRAVSSSASPSSNNAANTASSADPPVVPSATDSGTSDPSSDSNDRDESGDAGTPWAIILGSIGGAIAGTIILAMLIFFCFLRKRRHGTATMPPGHEGAAGMQEAKLKHVSESPDQPAGRRFDPSYHTSKDWKHKHRSFLDMLAGPPTGGAGVDGGGVTSPTKRQSKRQSKRVTELFNDPKSFFSPRPAPRPFAAALKYNNSNESVETLRYTTTSERLNSRNRTESFSSGSEVSFGVGPAKVVAMGYTKAKDKVNAQPPISAIRSTTFSTYTTAVPTQGPDGAGLLDAVNVMNKEDEDDPLDTPPLPSRAFGDSPGYPFPRVTTPPAVFSGREKSLPKPAPLKSRLSTKIPDSRFSSSAMTMSSLAPTPATAPAVDAYPPVTPATDFTLPPDEYRRNQSRYYSGPKNMTVYTDSQTPRASAAATLPSLYEHMPGATRFSLSQRTDGGNGIGTGKHNGWDTKDESDGESLIFSAAPSSASKYSSFIPDAQTVQRVKGMFGLSNVQFPLPPTTTPPRKRASGSASASVSGSDNGMSPQEWNKAKGKAKLTQEVMKIGKKGPVQEGGNDSGTRRGDR